MYLARKGVQRFQPRRQFRQTGGLGLTTGRLAFGFAHGRLHCLAHFLARRRACLCGGHIQPHERFQAQTREGVLLQAGVADDRCRKYAPGLTRRILPQQDGAQRVAAVAVYPAPGLSVRAAHLARDGPAAGRCPGQGVAAEACGQKPPLHEGLHGLRAQGQAVPFITGDRQGVPIFLRHGHHGIEAVKTRGAARLQDKVRPKARGGRGQFAAHLDVLFFQTGRGILKIFLCSHGRVQTQGRHIDAAGRGHLLAAPDVALFARGRGKKSVQASLTQKFRQPGQDEGLPEGLTRRDRMRVHVQP